MVINTDKPGPGKFQACEYESVAEYLYSISLDGHYEETYGESESSAGWNALLIIDVSNFASDSTDDPRLTPDKLKPAYIINEDNNGFFTYREFEHIEDARDTFMAELAAYEAAVTSVK